MFEMGPSAIDVAIITAGAGALWTLYNHIRGLTKERQKEIEVNKNRIVDIEMDLRSNYMTIERFEELERRLYEGMSGISQRLDDILKSLIAPNNN
jgi:hypothetical protein